ncbi:hypothetical protein GLAREA_12059 [Glarea lozoyensis ATCC 20868]|uniref:MFS maltose permease n=1 Tax=Glarea lozoyensis (strain ATCC 20868 / MF5171) TaxID=1116229 RepID=S3D0C2_GLAL2|nr:uncharacterized protein GLAREA_12059 [Glarea lozoyensis ATCC 20868]EPE31977.1 hypothetical protein GLAREA_12059 [Glarea lozoyensis ATCC 20868]
MRPRLPIRRVLFLRPFRPPNSTRLFTRNTLPHTRPSLQFLSPPTRRIAARYLTTETKVWLKDEVKKGLKITAYAYAFAALAVVIALGVHTEWTERNYHPPPEWTWSTRTQWKTAKLAYDEDEGEKPFIDWPQIGQFMRIAIERLENPNVDGAGLEKQGDGGIWVDGVGETGYDITNKSEPWRRGYYDALFLAAKSSEYLEECMKDKVSGVIVPKKYVIGPSNPKPRPMPPGSGIQTPLEENSEPCFEPPQHYYMKILTTKGFTERQYVDAALGYAGYLDYKQAPETALEMYKWAMDHATSSPEAKSVIDTKTGILTNTKAPSENILNVSRALAVHHAQNSNITLALPIFLSVLRAYRSLPEPPPPPPPQPREARTISKALTRTINTLFTTPPHPPPPPDGTSQPLRTPSTLCTEAGLMTNIGEILYSSTPSIRSKEDGLAWTREAVDIAEEQLTRSRLDGEGIKNCKQCLGVAIENWNAMVELLANEEREAKKGGVKKKSTGWFGKEEVKEDGLGRWESEEIVVREKRRRAGDILDKGPSPPKRRSPLSFLTV